MANKLHLSKLMNDNGIDNITDNYPLPSALVNTARRSISLDADSFFVNALITFASAINSINKNNYSWAFVQLYYTIFYCARMSLAQRDIGIFYSSNRKPFRIKIAPGELFHKKSGNSHEIYLKEYADEFGSDPFYFGQIEGKDVINWFEDNRNIINYRKNPMEDPMAIDECYKYNNDLRKWLITYESDPISYSFSVEHGYVAYPYNLIIKEVESYIDNNKVNDFITSTLLEHIKTNLSDKKGSFPSVISRIEKICRI